MTGCGDSPDGNTADAVVVQMDGVILVPAVGIDNLVIISTKDVVMVANKDKVPDVAKIVKQLKDNSRIESELRREVYRPWGKYDSIDAGVRYQVKRITVKPGA